MGDCPNRLPEISKAFLKSEFCKIMSEIRSRDIFHFSDFCNLKIFFLYFTSPPPSTKQGQPFIGVVNLERKKTNYEETKLFFIQNILYLLSIFVNVLADIL